VVQPVASRYTDWAIPAPWSNWGRIPKLSGWTDENHESPQSGWSISGCWFQPWISRIWSRNVTYSLERELQSEFIQILCYAVLKDLSYRKHVSLICNVCIGKLARKSVFNEVSSMFSDVWRSQVKWFFIESLSPLLEEYILNKRDKLYFHFFTSKLNWILDIITCTVFWSARFSEFYILIPQSYAAVVFASGNRILRLKFSLLALLLEFISVSRI
jgi:hypothetical protein